MIEDSFPLEKYLPNVPRGTLVPTLRYLQLLFLWNEKINLTGASTPEDFCHQHLRDAFQAGMVAGPSPLWLDVGAGGGVPGIPWALLRPQEKFYLVEGKKKKAAFLQRVVSELRLSHVQVLPCRLEELPKNIREELSSSPFKCVSRGTADPKSLLQLIHDVKIPWQTWLVFSSEKTHTEFLTSANKFAIKVSALSYEKGLEEEAKKIIGILTVLRRSD